MDEEYEMPRHVADAVEEVRLATTALRRAHRRHAKASLAALIRFVTSIAPGTATIVCELDEEDATYVLDEATAPAVAYLGDTASENGVPTRYPFALWWDLSDQHEERFAARLSLRNAPESITFTIDRLLGGAA